jgi:hypothetical protein
MSEDVKLVEIPVEGNAFVEKFLVADNGDVAILYKGAFFYINIKTQGCIINEEPLVIGPSIQIRMVKM